MSATHSTLDDLCYLSATNAITHFKDKKLSPVELLKALIVRAEQVEPKINAFTATYFDEALAQAALAEKKYFKGEDVGPLEGIPIALKDEAALKGKITTQGSIILKDYRPEKSAPVNERLEQAGAIFHARTACPEFCSLWTTYSRLHGITRNPWNLDVTPGGSSGGSAASLAAGTTILASGSDIGGSIRQPAAMCGVVGYKPPYGRNPEDGTPFNLDTYNHQGPLARTVRDCALMQNIMCGPHPEDISTVKPKYEIPLNLNTDMRGFKIAYSINLDYVEVEPDVIKATMNTLAIYKELGAIVEEVHVSWDKSIDAAYHAHIYQIFGESMADFLENNIDDLCDYNVYYAQLSRRASKDPKNYYRALVAEANMYKTFGPMMENYDVFICPTTTTTSLKTDFAPHKDKFFINGKEEDNDASMAMCHQFNMMSRVPTLAIPSGFGVNGVPTSIQITGKTYDDVTVFRAAAALEDAQPWLHNKSHRPAL